jgi:hypothetical protein
MKRRIPLRAALHVQACQLVVVRGARRGHDPPHRFGTLELTGRFPGWNRRFNV